MRLDSLHDLCGNQPAERVTGQDDRLLQPKNEFAYGVNAVLDQGRAVRDRGSAESRQVYEDRSTALQLFGDRNESVRTAERAVQQHNRRTFAHPFQRDDLGSSLLHEPLRGCGFRVG
ncbi:hypothetical protein D3C73_1406530 [compost metagenome]